MVGWQSGVRDSGRSKRPSPSLSNQSEEDGLCISEHIRQSEADDQPVPIFRRRNPTSPAATSAAANAVSPISEMAATGIVQWT